MKPPIEASNCREFSEYIRQRPAMYLGERSLTALSRFLFGYTIACLIHRVPEAAQLEPIGLDAAFVRWLEANGVGYGSRCPMDQLVELCGSEAAAFDRFFELLDEFECSTHRV